MRQFSILDIEEMSSSFFLIGIIFLAKMIATSFFFSSLIFRKHHANTSLKYFLLILGHSFAQSVM